MEELRYRSPSLHSSKLFQELLRPSKENLPYTFGKILAFYSLSQISKLPRRLLERKGG